MSFADHPTARHLRACALRVTGAAAVGLAVAGGAAGAEPMTVAEVNVRHVVRQCFVRSVHATGYIVPRAGAVVMFNAPDYRISQVLAKPGDVIERDDIVAKAVAATARPGEASKPEVGIRSLAGGLILKSTAFVGMPTSAQAEPLFTLALDGDLEAMVDVPGIHVFELEAGQVAHVSLRDGTVLDGHVRRAPVVIDGASQSGQARISFDPGARLTLGRFIWAKIEANRSCGAGVPRAAITKSSGGPLVQVVEDGVVVTRPVKVGLASDTDIEVTGGLRDGELVVANAGAALRDGDHIKPILADPQDLP